MAGLGSRFADEGYSKPKPFIDVDGKPMIRRVIEHLNLLSYEHIFLCREEHLEEFNMSHIFDDIKHTIVPVVGTTEGAAITVSLVESLIDTDEDILVVNSDQLVYYNSFELEHVRKSDVDGCIWCFHGTGPNWSYVRLNEDREVVEVAEKKEISNYATGGMYYWKSFRNYLKCLDRMIYLNDRVNGEFYVAPVYNYTETDSKVIIKMLDHIDQLGTPAELRVYEDKIRLSRNN